MKICLSCEGVAATDQDRCVHCDVPLLPVAAVHFPVRRGEVDTGNPLLGSVIDGKFLLQGVLGRGGMGTVFRACHAVSQVPVALKLLHPRLSVRAEFRRALLAEARKAGRVVHDHCARVLDVGETDEGTVYLAMELAEGETLDAWVRSGPLPPAVAISVLTQIARALVAIHAAGLVHRDLSSRNVMIAVRDGVPAVKVLDFGIAQSLLLASRVEERAGGEAGFANPVFSAPEHLAGQEVDARADLYSFGVVAYLVLTGRLPVDLHDARAAARATVAGQLLPLAVRPGVPRRLLRLVQRCLQRDRQQRPASAAVVLAELLQIGQGRASWLARASVAVAGTAVVAALLTLGRGSRPFLQLVGGLQLAEGSVLRDAAPHYLTSRELRSISARFGGFAADRLVVEATRGNQRLRGWTLRPAVESPGTLVLSDTQGDWRDAVAGIASASASGPVEISFLVPGRAVLGSARVQVDDTAPELAWELDATARAARAVNSHTRVHWQVGDASGIQSLRVKVTMDSGRDPFERLLETLATGDFGLGEELARVWPTPAALGPGTVALEARDRAGNLSQAMPVRFDQCDVGVPVVTEVTGGRGETTIAYREDRAALLVQLSAVESELRFSVRDQEGRERLADVTGPDARGGCRLQLAGAPAGEPFADGLFTFSVEDAAGNRSEQRHKLAFRNWRIDAAVAPGSGSPPPRLVGDEIVAGPAGCTLAFTCNPSFVPRTAQLRPSGNAPSPGTAAVRLLASAAGQATIAVDAPPGVYELAVDLERGDSDAGTVPWSHHLRVLPAAPVLQVPDTNARFLQQLVKANVFKMVGELLREDEALRIDPGMRRYLRGKLWRGADRTALAPLPLATQDAVDGGILPPVRPLIGRNVLALELRDVLDRKVAVTVGERPAEPLRVGELELDLLADFWFDPAPLQLIGEELLVEFGQPARLRLRSTLPFLPDDKPLLKLAGGGGDYPAAEVRNDGAGGAELVFLLPVDSWSDEAHFDSLQRADYARGATARIERHLRTPAGDFLIAIPLRTVRTTLRPVSLGEVATARATLPVPIAVIAMVPVLAPDGATFPDPVPANAPGRALYRPQPSLAVHMLGDCFVQADEFTMAQYAAVLEQLPVATAAAEARAFVHADDPLGPARLLAANLVPAVFAGDGAAFAARAAATPAAAVAGVDFFQAWAVARLLGALVGGDPRLFRLPLGCELELAAFGTAATGGARYAVAAHGGRVSGDGWRRAADLAVAAASGPSGPSAAQCRSAGDAVESPFGPTITGLDFGLREWVLDLPWGAELKKDDLWLVWSQDRELLRQQVLKFAAGDPAPPNQQARLRTFGVVRGLPLGADAGLLDAAGAPLQLGDASDLPGSVPGVVRTEQLRRDGRDLEPGALDPRLLRTGFRLVGGDAFVSWVRGR